MVPADTATPDIAGAIAGSVTSKITITPGPLAALPYIATSLPPAAASTCSTAAWRLVLGFSLIALRACGVYSAVKQKSIGVSSLLAFLMVKRRHARRVCYGTQVNFMRPNHPRRL